MSAQKSKIFFWDKKWLSPAYYALYEFGVPTDCGIDVCLKKFELDNQLPETMEIFGPSGQMSLQELHAIWKTSKWLNFRYRVKLYKFPGHSHESHFVGSFLDKPDGPAVTYGNNYRLTRKWFCLGVAERLDGPAEIDTEGYSKWFVGGKQLPNFDKTFGGPIEAYMEYIRRYPRLSREAIAVALAAKIIDFPAATELLNKTKACEVFL